MPNKPTGNGLFVLFYGDEGDFAWEKIRNQRPNLVIVQEAGAEGSITPEILQQDDDGPTGIRVLSYLATGYTNILQNEFRNALREKVNTALQMGFDGIFFDEIVGRASTIGEQRDLDLAYSDITHALNKSLVIFNPGVSQVDNYLFDHSDIVCVENKYFESPIAYAPDGRVVKHESWRWLAVQGDPSPSAAESFAEAKNRMQMFRQLGGFWYYSTPRMDQASSHWILPSWFDDFADHVKAGPSVDLKYDLLLPEPKAN